jgi:hypothetical protein
MSDADEGEAWKKSRGMESWEVVDSNFLSPDAWFVQIDADDRLDFLHLQSVSSDQRPYTTIVARSSNSRPSYLAGSIHLENESTCTCIVRISRCRDRLLVSGLELATTPEPGSFDLDGITRGVVFRATPTRDGFLPWVELVRDQPSAKRARVYEPPVRDEIMHALCSIPGRPLSAEGIPEMIVKYTVVDWE